MENADILNQIEIRNKHVQERADSFDKALVKMKYLEEMEKEVEQKVKISKTTIFKLDSLDSVRKRMNLQIYSKG